MANEAIQWLSDPKTLVINEQYLVASWNEPNNQYMIREKHYQWTKAGFSQMGDMGEPQAAHFFHPNSIVWLPLIHIEQPLTTEQVR